MKVLCIIPAYYPAFSFGGPIQSVHLLNKFLVKNDVDVYVLTSNAGLRINNKILLNVWNNVDGVKVKYLNYFGYENFTFSLQFTKEIFSIIKDFHIVHIHAVWNYPVLISAIASYKKNIPYIISTRGSIYRETVELNSMYIKKIYFNCFIKKYFCRASAIHFTTKDEELKVLDYLNLRLKYFTLPNGINVDEFSEDGACDSFLEEYDLKNPKKYIISLSRIDKKKGFDILIPALAEHLRNNRDLYLVIAGSDSKDYKKDVKRLCIENGIIEKVIFTGNLLNKTKESALKNALFFVLTSYSENFGQAVIEAMLCKTPVLITDKVGIAYELTDGINAMICNSSVTDISKKVEKLIFDSNLREKIGNSGYKIVLEKFNINVIAKKMSLKYNEIIQSTSNKLCNLNTMK